MIFGSVCSGIEAASVAWHPLGWKAAFLSEIDKFPRAALTHHYPTVPLHGDFTTIQDGDYEPIDLLVGGTPCQSFSIAGLRGGLADARGNLALEYLRLADRLRPRWVVWENVPGVLSSNGGRDFGSFLGALGKLRYGFAYRVLDAEYFGLAQRRKRVFVVGYLGDWRRAAAVLFEPQSLRRDNPPSREARKDVAPTISARTKGGGGLGTDFDLDGGLIAYGGGNGAGPTDVATACNAHGGSGRIDFESETFVTSYRTSPNCGAWETGGRIGAPTTGTDQTSHLAPLRAATGGSRRSYVARSGVRRLTPRECERLQGFHDDYTAIPYRGKPAADGPRYKALGNSMAVPVMRWIGRRIQMVEDGAL